MRNTALGCGLNLCGLSGIELACMNGSVEDIVPDGTSKPSAFIPGFEVQGRLFEVEIKGVQETAVVWGMQRVVGWREGWETEGRAGSDTQKQ